MGIMFKVLNFLSGDSLRSTIAYGISMNLRKAYRAKGVEEKDFFITNALDEVNNLFRM